MALLPLASWAEENFSADKTIVAVSRIEYQQAEDPVYRVTHDGLLLHHTTDPETNDYDLGGFFEKNDGTGSALALSDLQVGKTYYVRVDGKGVYTGSAYGAFTVEQATLTVSIATDADFTQFYLTGSDYTLKADKSDVTVTWTGHTIANKNDYVAFGTDYGYSYGTNKNADTYPITFTGVTPKDDNNFKVVYATRNMVIKPQTISGSAPYYTTRTAYEPAADKQFTYSAAVQKPTYTVAWDHDGDEGAANATAKIALVEGTDFTVKYFVGGTEVAANKVIGAATYGVKIVGTGNYTGTVDFTASADYQFIIKKAPLTIMTLPQEKVYDGTAFDLATAKFNIAGRVGADASKTVTGLAATGTVDAAQNSYPVNVNTSSATIGDPAVALSTNYDITTVAVDWIVKKRPVTLTVPQVIMTKGEEFPSLPTLAAANVEKGFNDEGVTGETGAINATDQTAIAGYYTLAYANAEGEPLNGVTAGASGNIKTQDYANAIKATGTNSNANYEVTIAKGTLRVQGAAFTVMPVVESDIEYGNTYTISYYAGTATIDETKLVFVINGTEYPYAAQIANLPTARGNYTVTIKEGTAVGTGNNLNGTATLQTSAYTIQKRKLNLTVKNQTVHKEDPTTILAELTAGSKGYTLAEGQSLVGEDVLDLTYSFDTNKVNIADGKIKGFKSTYDNTTADAIKVTASATAAVNQNYDITIVTGAAGKLTISTTFTADLAAATAEATITEAANNGSKYDVTISGRKLNANAWNVLVLPFEVKTFDFCKAINGYAVFNVLKSVDGDDVKFKLELDKIPANQPFLVKPLAAVDFDATSGTPAVKTIKFTGVTFVDATPTQSITGADFIGTYVDTTIDDDDYWALQGGEFKHFATSNALKFTRAYIKLASGSAAARFFVEEPGQNGTTAIKELNTKTMESVAADGWYSVNGVRLQGAPTQKGIYIKDGKKVIVK